MMPDNRKQIDRLGYVLTIAMTIWFFLPVLNGSSEFGFRDTNSLYQPLFEWAQAKTHDGELPIWNSQDNWGAPVLADATSITLYPAKLIFLLPFPAFHILFGVFVTGHILLAVFACRWCAKRLGISDAGSWLAGLSFGFGGCVLFQSCNIVFLIGASWLPVAMGLAIKFRSERKLSTLLGLAAVLCMMILGGDPQMVYHALIASGIIWCVHPNSHEPPSLSLAMRLMYGIASLAIIVGLTILLAAAQVLPSFEWSKNSERSVHENDRSIYQAFSLDTLSSEQPGNSSSVDRIGNPHPGSHQDAIYQFSLMPWMLIDLIMPNQFSSDTSNRVGDWFTSLPGNDRLWTESIYLGILALVLALAQFFCGPQAKHDRSLRMVFWFFLVGSFGWYGLGWLVNELNLMRGGTGVTHLIGCPTGGLYWCLEIFAPAYNQFRYPAKLFTVAALVTCLAAGKGLNTIESCHSNREANHTNDQSRHDKQMRRFALILCSLLLLLTGTALCFSYWSAKTGMVVNQLEPNLKGPQPYGSYVISICVLCVAVVLIWLKQTSRIKPAMFAGLLLGLVSADLAFQLRWTVRDIPVVPLEQRGERLEESIYRPGNLYLAPNSTWTQESESLRSSLFPKHHLTGNQRLIGSYSSIQPLDVEVLLQEINLMSDGKSKVLAALSVTSRIASDNGLIKRVEINGSDSVYFTESIAQLNPINNRSLSTTRLRTRQVLDMLRRWQTAPHKLSVVECEDSQISMVAPTIVNDRDKADCTGRTLTQHTFQVTASQPRLLVLAEYFDDNWFASSSDGEETIELQKVRVNRVLTGIIVPAGTYSVNYEYRPKSMRTGFWISLVSWSTLAGFWIRQRLRD